MVYSATVCLFKYTTYAILVGVTKFPTHIEISLFIVQTMHAQAIYQRMKALGPCIHSESRVVNMSDYEGLPMYAEYSWVRNGSFETWLAHASENYGPNTHVLVATLVCASVDSPVSLTVVEVRGPADGSLWPSSSMSVPASPAERAQTLADQNARGLAAPPPEPKQPSADEKVSEKTKSMVAAGSLEKETRDMVASATSSYWENVFAIGSTSFQYVPAVRKGLR